MATVRVGFPAARRPPVTSQVTAERRAAGQPDPDRPAAAPYSPPEPLRAPCGRRRRIDQAEGATGPCCPSCGRPWTDHDEAAA